MKFHSSFIVLFISLIGSTAHADPWVDDWIDQSTVASPSYFEGQRRGYVSGGSFQARWRMTNDNLFTVQPPRIKSGCGGIDVFAGGLSFLDPDLLVDKLQGIIQAAPAVAFDMALKTMCKECSETMKAMERAASWMNSLQLNDCAMSKRLVATVSSDDPDILGDMWSEISGGVSLNEALNRNYNEHQTDVKANGGLPTNPLQNAVRDCPADFQAIFANGGSVIENITNRLGFNAYGDLLRGYIGDVVIEYVPANNMFNVETVDACRGNDKFSFEDFLTGDAQERPTGAGAVCVANTGTDLYGWVSNQLVSIADKIRDGAPAYTADEEAFIESSPLPVFTILKTAVATGNRNAAIASIRDPLATAYAYKAIDDLYINVGYMIDKAIESSEKGGVSPGGDIDYCQPKILEAAIAKVRKWKPLIFEMRKETKSYYDSKLQSLVNHLTVVRAELEREKELNRKFAKSIQE